MSIKSYLRYVWLAIGVFSLILLAFDWFGYGSQNIYNAIHFLNVLMFILSVPCSLFFIPVGFAANHYLEMSPTSGDGIYLSTICLFALRFTQWFWIARFWRTTEPPFQKLDLIGGKSK